MEIDALPFDRFVEVVEDAVDTLREDERRQYQIAAFIGWQVLSALGAKPGTFGQYLKRLRLDG